MGDVIGSGIPALQLAMAEYLRDYQFRSLIELVIALVLVIMLPAILLVPVFSRFKKEKAITLVLVFSAIMSLASGIYVYWNRETHTVQFNKYVRLYMDANDESMRKLMDINSKSVELLDRLQSYLPREGGQ